MIVLANQVTIEKIQIAKNPYQKKRQQVHTLFYEKRAMVVQVDCAIIVYDPFYYENGTASFLLHQKDTTWLGLIEERIKCKLRHVSSSAPTLQVASLIQPGNKVRFLSNTFLGDRKSLFAGVQVRFAVRITSAWICGDQCGVDARLIAIEALEAVPAALVANTFAPTRPPPPPPPPPPGPPPPPPPPVLGKGLVFLKGNSNGNSNSSKASNSKINVPKKPWVPSSSDIIEARNRLKCPKFVYHLHHVPALAPCVE